MGELATKKTGSGADTYLMVPILIFFMLLIFAVIRGPNLISSAGIGSAVIVVAPLILATYALTIIVMAGRAGVDLSIGPLIGFINVGMIQLYAAGFMESPIAFFLYAMGVGVAYQLFVGLIIIFVRVQPIIVSLSGYLALVGLNLIIMPRPGGVAPDWMFPWGAGTTIFSATLVILVLATAGWYLIARTAFFGHLRLMGSDERAAYTSGVRINMVRLGAHAIGGVYAGLAAIAFTALISSGDPSQGTTYTLMAVTALVLGGANLAGGRGGAFGSLLGALNIYLITYALSTFNFGMVQSYVTDLAYGVMLVVSLLISVAVPQLRKYISNLSPLVFFVILAVIALGVIMHTSMDQQLEPLRGFAAASVIILSDGGVAQGTAASADAYSAGTYILFVIIGAVVVIYAFRQLFKHFNASMIGFMVILAITALGLIFNPEISDDEPAATATMESASTGLDAYIPNYDAMETIESSVVSLDQSLVQSSYAVISISGVVLLASLIILVMLPLVSVRTKRVASLLFAAAVAIIAIGALFFDGFEQGYLVGNLPGEIYAVVLVGMGLFILTAPLLHTKFSNISNVFIVSIGVLAIISIYFFTEPNNNAMDQRSTSQTSNYAPPVLVTTSPISAPAAIEYASPVITVTDDSERMDAYMQVAYCAFIIVMLHVFLQIAMGEFSFRSFWRYWYIPVMASFIWGGLFYAVGIALWQIVLVIGIAIIAAPNVMHIIGTYIIKQRRDRAISQWDG
ncbi:MAG: ribose transport system permease protein [Gammaproteobacteria bacterium]|jgi:ribose transport system permease protein